MLAQLEQTVFWRSHIIDLQQTINGYWVLSIYFMNVPVFVDYVKHRLFDDQEDAIAYGKTLINKFLGDSHGD